jgi:CheY-like chemotaxis protein
VSEAADPAGAAGRHPIPSALLHDMRTPLNHVIGYSELMMEQAEEEGHAGLLPHLRKVCAAAHHLVALIGESFESTPAAGEPVAGADGEEPGAARWDERLETVATAGASAAGRGSLLVVDRDGPRRDVLSRLLERQGYAVARAADGPEALAMLRAGPFDVVLLDVTTPEGDGCEVLRRIRADDRLKQLAVIATSTATDVEAVARCLEMGAEDHLTGPLHPALLDARVRASLERKRARDRENYLLEQLQDSRRRVEGLGTPGRMPLR